jgi:Ca2+-binding RTX toxin-like protein
MAELTGDKLDNSITGTSADDLVSGLAGDDTLIGGGGGDTLIGNNGADILHGGDGDDLAKGGRGVDLLYGETGNDILYGGEGADRMTGGTGADTFLFKAPDADGSGDDILDFTHDLDHIDVSDLDVSRISGSLDGVAGELAVAWNGSLGITILQYDAGGDGLADLTIRVIGLVDAGDIVV